MMTWTRFYDSVEKCLQQHKSVKAIILQPRLDRLPLPIQRYDEPFLPLSRAIIQSTRDFVSLYIFDLAAYLATGAAGVVALERSIAYAREDAITILHGPFTGTGYSVLADDASLTIDAITVSTPDDLAFYTGHPPYGAFLFDSNYVEEEIEEGGVMNLDTLTLYHSHRATIIGTVMSSGDLLSDLTDTYQDTIRSKFT